MIICKLMDGLGNQLFEYAFARVLQEIYDEPIGLELCNYSDSSVRQYGLNNFKLNDRVVILPAWRQLFYKLYSKSVRIVEEKVWHRNLNQQEGFSYMIHKYGIYATYESIKYFPLSLTKKRNKIIRGYFQSSKYYDEVNRLIKKEIDMRRILLDEFHVTTAPSEENQKLLQEIDSCNAVCVHIRGGDYRGSKRFDICGNSYYNEGMKVIAERVDNPIFYAFTYSKDDREWIRKNYNFDFPIRYVELENPDYEELRLMSHCKHFVIANSTFSWWAQYLSHNTNKIVVAPSKWYGDDEMDDRDIYMDDWITIDV